MSSEMLASLAPEMVVVRVSALVVAVIFPELLIDISSKMALSVASFVFR